MSGGSLDYAFCKLNEVAEEIHRCVHGASEYDGRPDYAKNPLYDEFVAHLRLVSDALKDIEWVFSGDCGEGAADEAMRKVLK